MDKSISEKEKKELGIIEDMILVCGAFSCLPLASLLT